jgi:hypothetical protein
VASIVNQRIFFFNPKYFKSNCPLGGNSVALNEIS